jgi:hypothetical protein
MKQCKKCKFTKEFIDFRIYERRNKIWYSGTCKSCIAIEKKEWVLANWEKVNSSNIAYNRENAHIIRGNKLTKYWPGTDWKQATDNYNDLLKNQNNVCALCKRAERRNHSITGTIWDLAVDHCHETNKVRGLLCNACNRGLGLLGDKVDTLENVLLYLKKHLEDK